MAARQSYPLCAPTGLLLLLIGVISSHLPDVQAKPITFWCNSESRKHMENKIEQTEKDMAGCVGSDTLPSPVQLPFVGVQPAEWANKTLQQKCAEVVGALRMLQDGVQRATNQTSSQCQTSLLGDLERSIRNHLAIINSLQIQNDTATPAQPAETILSSSSSLKDVLTRFRSLLKGKLNRLANDLQDSICTVEKRHD